MKDEATRLAQLDALKRVEGVCAVPPDTRGQAARDEAVGLAVSDALVPGEVDEFLNAGWAFVDEAHRTSGNLRHVYRDGDGQLKIDSGSLNVRFVEEVSTEEIAKLLNAHHLSIKRQLKFAPNLFTVGTEAGADGSDAVDAARRLSSLEAVKYAEPVLIESLGGRTAGR